jgi:uncharacterized lipoprotein YmbA
MTRIAAMFALALVTACGGKPPPPTRYYQLAPPAQPAAPDAQARGALVIEPFTAEGAYDDERMVYRASPYRLDYYDYHRWGAPPGQLLASYLEQALRKTGRFHTVAADSGEDGALTLSGRVIAIEEVDTAKTKWVGRVALELSVRDASGKVVWTGQFDESVPMPVQSPEGLAHAVTAAMQQIATRVAPQLGQLAERQGGARQRTVWRDGTSRAR